MDGTPLDFSRTINLSSPQRPRRFSQGAAPYPSLRAIAYRNSVVSIRPELLRSRYSDGDSSPMRHLSFLESIPYSSSTHQEKLKATKKTISAVFGLCYVIFLVVFALIAFVGSSFVDVYPLPQLFCILCMLVGLCYIVFLFVRVRMYVSRSQEVEEGSSSGSESGCHKYCFLYGRHGELYYLKVGAAVFCLGSVIHSVLILCYQVVFLTSQSPDLLKCASITTLLLESLFAIYCLLVLFFLFKYANVIINEFRELARIGLMHNLGTALAMWVFTIVRETKDAIYVKSHSLGEGEDEEETILQDIPPMACPGSDALDTIFKNFSPYLYPFIIEFCIVVAGIFYGMWANVSKCRKTARGKRDGGNQGESGDDNLCFDAHDLIPPQQQHQQQVISRSGSVPSLARVPQHAAESNNRHSNILVVDCHAANRGIFAAMILLVATIVVIILLFIASSSETPQFQEMGFTINSIYDITCVVVMLITTILAYYQTSKLDINPNHVSHLDDVLLFIAVPAFFANLIFSALPSIASGRYLSLAETCMNLLQIIVQTPFIIDGLRRCSNSFANQKYKPGRGLVTFLTGANVTLWIYFTFASKDSVKGDVRYQFYGEVIWTILSHITNPLVMFYRFHSSVCLVEIWKHAYEFSSSH